MTARPTLVVVSTAALGAIVLLAASPSLPPSPYAPAAIGALVVFVVASALLRALRPRDRWAMAAGVSALGFLVGAVSGVGPQPWPLAFAAAWLPAYLLFLGGLGRERLAFELARLEEACDEPGARPRVIARATVIRDEAREAASAIDPGGSEAPLHPGDPRAVYAYGAQVVAYTHALDRRFDEAAKGLGAVPVAWMPAPMRPLMLANLAFWLLCAKDAAGALAAVDRVREEDAPAESRAALRVMRAAALVHHGDAAGALALVGRTRDEGGEPERLRARYAIVRAHALAAEGDAGAARAEIVCAIEMENGNDEARRWLDAGGPAIGILEEALGGPAAAA